ncbi:DUF1543 domain-containing protein [Thiotrichales bacterium 19S3-7]|nr:DUF1543 domain-containing protein [Thiotrichales bacterium 19S3-7]MCF6802849.1 DUF1543 domain-containing protein [Thiotrichales bacterium 19S3-11]
MKMKLFAVMLGGRTQGAHIELHDLVFVVGNALEDTYPNLVRKWFGNTHKSLHIDSSLELDIIDGYQVTLSSTQPSDETNSKKLHCVNFGGYKEGFFGEIHEVSFIVSNSKKEVTKKAKNLLCVDTLQQHCDDNFVIGSDNFKKDVDDVITVNHVDGYYIHLTPTENVSKQKVKSQYIRLDVPNVLSQLNTESEVVA